VTPQSLALAAASQATEAAAELIRFVREEGTEDQRPAPFEPGDVEVAEKLADALKMTLEAMAEAMAFTDEHGQLLAACDRFLDGWVG
jgi:hypothetical protein